MHNNSRSATSTCKHPSYRYTRCNNCAVAEGGCPEGMEARKLVAEQQITPIKKMVRADDNVDRIYGITESGQLAIVVCREPVHPYFWRVHSLVTEKTLDRDQYSNDIIERAEHGLYDDHTSKVSYLPPIPLQVSE